MTTPLDDSATASAVRLGHAHGYRLDGDRAFLNAELSISPGADVAREGWALQLWACARPHEDGPLDGLKIAEVELALADAHGHALREAESFARLPLSRSEYNMVLVLASGERGRFDQVRDFSNYTERQQFAGPELVGAVSHRFVDGQVVLHVDAVRNARDRGNLSGDLWLELWASEGAHRAGELRGARLGAVALGRLAGQASLEDITHEIALETQPGAAEQLTLALTEWTHDAGYVTRAFRALSSGALPAKPVEVKPAEVKPVDAKPAEAKATAPAPLAKTGAKSRASAKRAAQRKK